MSPPTLRVHPPLEQPDRMNTIIMSTPCLSLSTTRQSPSPPATAGRPGSLRWGGRRAPRDRTASGTELHTPKAEHDFSHCCLTWHRDGAGSISAADPMRETGTSYYADSDG